jgi:hypothetical protein
MLENDDRGGKRGFVKFSARNRRRPRRIRATSAARIQQAPPPTLDLSLGALRQVVSTIFLRSGLFDVGRGVR